MFKVTWSETPKEYEVRLFTGWLKLLEDVFKDSENYKMYKEATEICELWLRGETEEAEQRLKRMESGTFKKQLERLLGTPS